jgi:hypothetical protein
MEDLSFPDLLRVRKASDAVVNTISSQNPIQVPK